MGKAKSVKPDAGDEVDDVENANGVTDETPKRRRSGGTRNGFIRPSVFMDPKVHKSAQYWAKNTKNGPMSFSDYVAEAVQEKIARDCGRFVGDESLMAARMGQIIDALRSLDQNVSNSSDMTIRSLNSLIGLTRGENYLANLADDGELEDTGEGYGDFVGEDDQ